MKRQSKVLTGNEKFLILRQERADDRLLIRELAKELKGVKADIAYLSMMTGINLDQTKEEVKPDETQSEV